MVFRPVFWRLVRACLLALFAVGSVRATSVVAPTFSELVNEAEVIVRARVKSVRCAWVDLPQGRVIKTYVTLAVQKRLKGDPGAELTLQFLGGELDGQRFSIAGMPQFVEGRTEIVFVAGNGVQFCPLVAMMHGRYRVLTDEAAGRDYIARDDGVPLANEQEVKLPQEGGALTARFKSVSAALGVSVFEEKIAAEVARHAAAP